jgi:hypothetical protein
MKILNLFFLFCSSLFAQNQYPKDYFGPPLSIPLQLSGNFGELRPNHFHAGFDIKTQQKEGLKVNAVAEGYISRIKISTFGYGKAIYITHPNGYTSVYGHLKRMDSRIETFLKARQYEMQSFEVDLTLKPNELLVSKGEVIAFSGNTGGSEGPHLHFEIRETQSEKVVNPLFFGYDLLLNDTKKPSLTGLYVYPIDDFSVVNQSVNSLPLNLSLQKDGTYLTDSVMASGKIGFGFSGFDLASDSWDKNGIYQTVAFLNGAPIFKCQFDLLSFDEARYVNALIDFSRYKKTGQRVQKLFVKTPYKLSNIKGNGVVEVLPNINQVYRLEIADFKGNTTTVNVPISYSKSLGIDSSKSNASSYFVKTNKEYSFEKGIWSVLFPAGTFYDDFYLNFEVKDKTLYLENRDVAVHSNFKITVIDSTFSENDNEKLFIGVKQGSKIEYNSTKRKGNVFTTYTKSWGQFFLAKDITPPVVYQSKSIEGKNLSDRKTIDFSIKDEMSGIKSYNGYLNGRWILFEYDFKTKKITHYFDDGIVAEGRNDLKIVITDYVGNSTTFETHFFRNQKL